MAEDRGLCIPENQRRPPGAVERLAHPMTAAPARFELANGSQRGSHCGCSGLLDVSVCVTIIFVTGAVANPRRHGTRVSATCGFESHPPVASVHNPSNDKIRRVAENPAPPTP